MFTNLTIIAAVTDHSAEAIHYMRPRFADYLIQDFFQNFIFEPPASSCAPF